VLVSGSVKLSPCNSLIDISLKLYFKVAGVFHKAEENPVNKLFGSVLFPAGAHQTTKHSDFSFFSKRPRALHEAWDTFFDYMVKER
jgi:hypothetical protein